MNAGISSCHVQFSAAFKSRLAVLVSWMFMLLGYRSRVIHQSSHNSRYPPPKLSSSYFIEKPTNSHIKMCSPTSQTNSCPNMIDSQQQHQLEAFVIDRWSTGCRTNAVASAADDASIPSQPGRTERDADILAQQRQSFLQASRSSRLSTLRRQQDLSKTLRRQQADKY